MNNITKIDDWQYIFDLFKNLSRRKEIPVQILLNKQQSSALMSFNTPKHEEIYISVKNIKTELDIAIELEIRFTYKEILYTFQTRITGFINNKATIQYPSTIFRSFKRLVNRYMIEPSVAAYVYPGIPERQFRLRDINSQGLSLFAEDRLFYVGERIPNILIQITGEIEINASAEIKYFSSGGDGQFIYGLIFSELEWGVYQKLFSYIFQKSYPDFKPLAGFTMEKIAGLYEESRHFGLKLKDNGKQSFLDLIAKLELLNRKPEIASNLVHIKNEKLLTVGSVLRIYDRTFFGQPLLIAPGARLNPKAKTDAYIGLADFMLNHPYFESYLTYINDDLEWHREIYGKIDELINDRDKFIFDQMSCFECNVSEMVSNDKDISHEYLIEALDDPSHFLVYAAQCLPLLENLCYRYHSEYFDLGEIKNTYQAFGFSVHRKLWRVSHDQSLVAFIVAEAFSDNADPFGVIDTGRIYFVNSSNNSDRIIRAALCELSEFFKAFQKKIFTVIANVLENIGAEIAIPGLTCQKTLERVMASREGLAEYRRLLSTELENYTKYYPLSYPQKGIWYTEKLYPGTSIGNIAATIKVDGEIDYRCLEKAVNLFIEKNDAVRLRIIEKDEDTMQYVSPYEYRRLDFYDFSDQEPAGLYQWEERQTLKPFNLYDCDLAYFALIKLSDREGGFYGKLHHTLSDAWAMNLSVKQIMKFYSGLQKGMIIKQKNSLRISITSRVKRNINSGRGLKKTNSFGEMNLRLSPS